LKKGQRSTRKKLTSTQKWKKKKKEEKFGKKKEKMEAFKSHNGEKVRKKS